MKEAKDLFQSPGNTGAAAADTRPVSDNKPGPTKKPPRDEELMDKAPDYTKWNIWKKMAAITSEIDRVGKNLRIQAGSEKYKAVAEVDVLDAVKPAELKYGVYSYPAERQIIETKEIQKTGYQGKERVDFFMRVETVYRFINVDNPEQFVDIKTYGDGVDSQDKTPGKAMTYADKYGLLKAYKISTGDDPDQKASEEYQPTKKNTQKANVEPAAAPDEIGEPVDNDASHTNILKVTFSGTGLTMKVVAQLIEQTFGRDIPVDDLTEKQFSYLKDVIRKHLKQNKNETSPYDYMDEKGKKQ